MIGTTASTGNDAASTEAAAVEAAVERPENTFA
jgi:hypothetical protein